MDEPLNKQKGKKEGVIRKVNSVIRRKKEFCKLTSFKLYILAFIIFIVLFFFFAFLIYRNLKKVSELDKVLKARHKELEDGDNTRIELLNQIDAVEKQIELKKKYIDEKRALDAEKTEEYNKQKKIYENIEEIQNKIIDENNISILLDESISNLNNRIVTLKS